MTIEFIEESFTIPDLFAFTDAETYQRMHQGLATSIPPAAAPLLRSDPLR
jgi:hypothetical protein